MEEEIRKESSSTPHKVDEETLTRVFAQLKTYSLTLLELHQNPKKQVATTVLPQLSHFLRQTPAPALQPFFDYAMFPLLLLLDGAVACRSQQANESQGKFGMPNVRNTPSAVSDSVAEGVLECLEELLNKCHLGSVNQMVVLLKKLTYGALLTPSIAAEEFREGIVRCFRALLLGLCACSAESCLCKCNLGLFAFKASTDLQILPVTSYKYASEPQECLLAFIRSENASAAVGHWLSLLLKTADSEAARGHRGSARLRIEAFLTFRVLVTKVGTADALAFFLPGVVSQLAKALQVSKTMISGAAGSTEAINQATRGLSEFLMIVLEDEANPSGMDMSTSSRNDLHLKDKSTKSVLEALRHFPLNAQYEHETLTDGAGYQSVFPEFGIIKRGSSDSGEHLESLYVKRTKDWIDKTSIHVDKLLSATFPQLCIHPAKKVRQGLVYAISGLLSKCSYTLKKSRLMLLECLCILVCDDLKEVSAAAQEFLEGFFMVGEKCLVESEISEIFNRLIEKLPKVVLGSDKTSALAHAQRLLAMIYYAGPQRVVDHVIRSPIMATRFLDALALCLNQNSAFAGSLDKFIVAKPFSVGYLHSIADLKSRSRLSSANKMFITDTSTDISKLSSVDDKHVQDPLGTVQEANEVPFMPPWFSHIGSHKLYQTLADILRLVGLSTIADSRSEVSLSIIVDIPLSYLRKLISEVRMKHYSKESWHSWYVRSGSGHQLRQASTASCILNEIIYGTSGQSVERYRRMFQKYRMETEESKGYDATCVNDHHPKTGNCMLNGSFWSGSLGTDVKGHLINCVGSILHEYFSPELWDLPIDQGTYLVEVDNEADDYMLHLFHDTEMLHKVIIDGIGIFSLSLGKEFASSGFLHSSLYVLLENLICSSYQIRKASDAVLHVISASCGYSTVGDLVVGNADYIIDSLCRQLRHLDANHNVPDVLAAMLSYIGIANEVLPLLEEPMRSISLELEVLGRHRHPNLTVAFLKAVAEIVKASKREAFTLPSQAEAFSRDVHSKLCDRKRKGSTEPLESSLSHEGDHIGRHNMESENTDSSCNDVGMHLEHLEELLFKFNKLKRYRRTVGSLAESCLTAAIPLLASVKESRCLVALDIIEDGITTLAKVEEAFRHEKETKQTIEHAIQLCSFHDLQDSLDVADEGPDENRLLPAMNKIWPYLVVCIKTRNPVAVRRCLNVVSNVVQVCGGDFFSRRFYKDGHHFWKLLTPFQQKPTLTDDKAPLQLPYRISSTSPDESMAETSVMKVQAAVLNMIADLSRNKRSASALEAVLKKVSGFVVGIACSSVVGLRDASINALSGVACIDPDLIWLLLADVFYSVKRKDVPSPQAGLPEIFDLLPPPSSPKDFLYIRYGGDNSGFCIDYSSAEIVFRKMHTQVFTAQLYS